MNSTPDPAAERPEEPDPSGSSRSFRALVEMLSEVADLVDDARSGSGGDRVGVCFAATTLAAASGRLDAAFSALASQVDSRGYHSFDGARSARSWFCSRTELSGSVVSSSLKIGRGLRDLPLFNNAWAAGRLGTPKIRLLLKLEECLRPWLIRDQQVLIDVLAPLQVAVCRRVLARWRELAMQELEASPDHSGPEPAAPVNAIHFGNGVAGEKTLVGVFDALTGLELQALVQNEIDRAIHAGEIDPADDKTLAQRQAEALLALCRRGTTNQPHTSKDTQSNDEGVDSTTPEPNGAIREADGVTQAPDGAIRTPNGATQESYGEADSYADPNPDPDANADADADAAGAVDPLLVKQRQLEHRLEAAARARININVHIDLPWLLGIPNQSTEQLLNQTCQAQDGTYLPLRQVLEHLDDASINLILGHLGTKATKFVPIGLISTRRLANATQRHLLQARDQQCRYPGCTTPATWAKAHHEPPFQSTHHTTATELLLLCPFHHKLRHHQGHQINHDGNGNAAVITPQGNYLPPTTPGHKLSPEQPRGTPPAAEETPRDMDH